MTTAKGTRRALRGRLGPMAVPGFAFFWSARTVSLIGDYAFRVAFITYIISVTHRSAAALAVANAVLLVPALVFYLFGGVLGDRVASRRRVMIVSDLGRCAVTAAIVACVALHAPVAVVVGCAVCISVGDGFFMPASFAYQAEIVPPDSLTGANSAISLSQQAGLIIGPLLGGLLIGLSGPTVAFGFDSGSFLASALLVILIPAALSGRRRAGTGDAIGQSDAGTGEAGTGDAGTGDAGAGPPGFLADVLGGLRYVRVQRWLLISCVVGALANAVFAGNLDVTVPLIVSPHGTADARYLGIFYALEGAGAVLGAIILARLVIRRAGSLMFGMMAMMGVSLALVGVFGQSAGTYLMAVAYGVGLHFFNSLYTTLVQQKVPGSLLSRVSSVLFLGFGGLMPLGTLLMAPLITSFGAAATITVTSVVIGALCLLAALPPSIRLLTAGEAAAS
jgi:MFS family permease